MLLYWRRIQTFVFTFQFRACTGDMTCIYAGMHRMYELFTEQFIARPSVPLVSLMHCISLKPYIMLIIKQNSTI